MNIGILFSRRSITLKPVVRSVALSVYIHNAENFPLAELMLDSSCRAYIIIKLNHAHIGKPRGVLLCSAN